MPTYEQDGLTLFESGAIVQHIAETHGGLMPDGAGGRARAIEWMYAALNTVEPPITDYAIATLFEEDKPWSKPRLPRSWSALPSGSTNWRGGSAKTNGSTASFSAGDLLMVAVLRQLKGTPMATAHDNLAAYVARGEARPAFQRALAAQLAGFTAKPPPGYEFLDQPPHRPRREQMTYVEGFVAAVPTENKETIASTPPTPRPCSRNSACTRLVENWGDDVPRGKVTDFYGAVQAKEDETIVFSWFEYPDKATRDAANEKMMADPRMKEMGADMPFDGKRMIIGGFDRSSMSGRTARPAMSTAISFPSPRGRRRTIARWPRRRPASSRNYGAVRVVEAWGDDVPEGKVTDYQRAVKAEDGEGIIYS